MIFLIFFFFSFSIFSEPILIHNNFESTSLGKELFYYEDSSGDLKIADLQNSEHQNKFIKSTKDVLNFGYTSSTYWIRIELQNVENNGQNLILEHSFPLIDNIQFYIFKNAGEWEERQTGDIFSFKQREFKNRNFLFDIELSPKQARTIYLRMKTTSSLQIPLKLYQKNTYINFLNDEQFVLGIYYGLIVVMLIYNILLYFSLLDSLHIYYVLYLTSFLFLQMGFNGISFEYLWNDYPYFNTLFPLEIFAVFIFLTLLSIKFLNTKENTPFLHRIFQGILFLFSILAAISLNPAFYGIMIRVAVFGVVVCNILYLIACFKTYLNGYKPARLYILAFTTIILGAVIYSFKNLGLVPSNFFTENTLQIGSALESLLLSFAVADKILFMRKEKEDAKNALILEQTKSLETQKQLIHSYARFVPEELLLFLGKDIITDVKLGDSVQKDMTVLFSDIRSFTTLSESMSPEESFGFINSYLKMIAPCIRKYNGYIDKFIGDGIMALFPDKKTDALNASLEMLDCLSELNLKRKEKGYAEISIGIGIHTGRQTLGIIGEEERLEGTVISDVVNTASRLEGLNKIYSSTLILSEEVLNEPNEREQYPVRLLGSVRVKGKNRMIKILEVLVPMTENNQLKLQTKSDFETAVQLYFESKFAEAYQFFLKVYERNTNDKAAEIYLERCNFYIRFGIDAEIAGVDMFDFNE